MANRKRMLLYIQQGETHCCCVIWIKSYRNIHKQKTAVVALQMMLAFCTPCSVISTNIKIILYIYQNQSWNRFFLFSFFNLTHLKLLWGRGYTYVTWKQVSKKFIINDVLSTENIKQVNRRRRQQHSSTVFPVLLYNLLKVKVNDFKKKETCELKIKACMHSKFSSFSFGSQQH